MKRFVGDLFILLFVMYNVSGLKGDKFEKAPECEKHGVYSADPNNCANYYVCFRGRLLKYRCQWSLHWNDQLKICDLPEDANCNGISEPIPIEDRKPSRKCAEHGVYSADPTNCVNYYMCFHGQLKKYKCHWGFHWNDREKKCDSPEDAKCNESPDETNETWPVDVIDPIVIDMPKPITITSLKCEKDGVYTADPENCANYMLCVQGVLMILQCHAGLHWNDREKKCDLPENANCNGIKDETNEGNVTMTVDVIDPIVIDIPEPTRPTSSKCENIGAFMPDPENCAQYIRCIQGVLVIFGCPKGLHWNDQLKKCDLPENANCNGIPHETIVPSAPVETVDPVVVDEPAIPTIPDVSEAEPIPPLPTSDTPVDAKIDKKVVVIPETCTEPLFACPDDCTKYYVCLHGRPFKMPCGPGTHWNDVLKVCDWPHNAGCIEYRSEHSDEEAIKPIPEPLRPNTPTESTRAETLTPTENSDNKMVICYFTNAALREPVRYNPLDLKWELCSHIIYSFAISDPETFSLRPADTSADIENKYYKQVTDLRRDGVRVSIAVNGLVDNDDDTPNPILTDATTRQNFVASAVEFIEKYNFDGLELDLEYAACMDSDCESQIMQERSGIVPLIQELSAALKPRGWLLSATASAHQKIIDLAYDIPEWADSLDWISLITFDYHNSFESRTGHNSPIYSNDNLNVDATVKYYIDKGAPSQKLIVGISGYGQSYALASADHGLNAETTGPAKPGTYSNVRGLLAYYEICHNTKHNGWTVIHDPTNQNSTYAYSTESSEWVSYNDVENIRAKAKYIKEFGLGGGMLWTLDFDDFAAKCGCGYYPLLTTLNQELRGIGGEQIQNCT